MSSNKTGKMVLDGRLDLESYEGIQLGFKLVTEAFIQGDINGQEAATFRALLVEARRTLNDKRKWVRPSLNEMSAHAEEEESIAPVKEASANYDYKGPFGVYNGGKSA